MSLAVVPETVPLIPDADGVLRVGDTRVTLDTVIAAFLEGATAEEITQQYPALRLADVYSVVGYYLRHQTAVDAYLDQRCQQADLVRREAEAQWGPAGIRARLLSRRDPSGDAR